MMGHCRRPGGGAHLCDFGCVEHYEKVWDGEKYWGAGQEEKNVAHVQSSAMGEYVPEPAALAARVSEWLADPPLLASLAANSRAAGAPPRTIWTRLVPPSVLTGHISSR